MRDTIENSPQLIYVLNYDGTGLTQLTFGHFADYAASWSPDGSELAFTTDRVGFTASVFVMNADGTGMRAVVSDASTNGFASWSPAANEILFQSTRGGVESEGVYRTTSTGDSIALVLSGLQPQWSSTGSQILFECLATKVCVSRTPEGAPIDTLPLDLGIGFIYAPKWSPDEQHIAYVLHIGSSDGPTQIFSASATDGSGVTQLTNGPGTSSAWWPDWTRH